MQTLMRPLAQCLALCLAQCLAPHLIFKVRGLGVRPYCGHWARCACWSLQRPHCSFACRHINQTATRQMSSAPPTHGNIRNAWWNSGPGYCIYIKIMNMYFIKLTSKLGHSFLLGNELLGILQLKLRVTCIVNIFLLV